jgi:hypothetical protein
MSGLICSTPGRSSRYSSESIASTSNNGCKSWICGITILCCCTYRLVYLTSCTPVYCYYLCMLSHVNILSSHPGIQLRCLSYLRWLVWCAQPGIIISVVSLSIALFRVFARDHPLAATIAPVANTTGT